MSTTFSQQILSDRLLLVVISRQKNALSCGFKLEPITIYHMQCCEYNTSQKKDRGAETERAGLGDEGDMC